MSASDIVTVALQRYADRGVFRGFSVRRAASGRCDYSFTWLTRRPMTVSFDQKTGVLTFGGLFPAVRSLAPLVADVNAMVAGRSSAELPPHKRLDRRRVTLASSVRGGNWSFTATVRGANHEYATRLAVNLVNELFLLLQEKYPDYLVEQFGFSGE